MFSNAFLRQARKLCVFNHPVDYLARVNTSDLNTTTGLLDLSPQVNDPRILQLSMRLEW
jgi:hypothetical protein